ncbi:MAG: hypothetical protein WD491_14205 [Balneolales bacterium]
MKIPIENIYYLLCYAWNKLDEAERIQVSAKDQTKLLDLFAKVLINGTRILLKRGVEKNYVDDSVELTGIKGKIDISETFKSGLYLKQRTVCSINKFSGDVLTNQILITTLCNLLKISELSSKLKGDIKPLIWMMPHVQIIKLTNRHFKQVKIHRNNQFYGFLINICQLIYENSLPSEDPGEWQFADFTRDEKKMALLFESFLYNFYKKEFPSWKVFRQHIEWNLLAVGDHDLSYLPCRGSRVFPTCGH